MSEDRFDELLRRMARDYNAPPETPREELWAAISAARTAPRTASRTDRRAWPWWLSGLAATLVLGITIGRFAAREAGAPAGGAPDGPVLEQAAIRTASEPRLPPAGQPSADAPAVSAPERGQGSGAPLGGHRVPLRVGPRYPAEIPAPPQRLARADSRPAPRAAGESPDARASAEDTAANPVYTLVATQTLAQGEALLTAFRAARRPDELDPQISAWAREVLLATSLLLDSPAGEEPVLRGLLEDLELVLLQIAQLSGSPADSAERAWINETLRRRDMLPRLRTAVPAGLMAGI